MTPAGDTPSRSASRRSRRVSSAAITGAVVSAATSRPDASSGRPMGVAASISLPAAGSSPGIAAMSPIRFPSTAALSSRTICSDGGNRSRRRGRRIGS
jgi:hypothetical protein